MLKNPTPQEKPRRKRKSAEEKKIEEVRLALAQCCANCAEIIRTILNEE